MRAQCLQMFLVLSSVIPVSCTGLVDVTYCHSRNCAHLQYAIGENKVDIMHVHVYRGLTLLTLSGNCATNCEFQLQLAHIQLQLPQRVIS